MSRNAAKPQTVFICYSHRDADLVYADVAWLEACELPLWYDDQGIAGGSNWRTEIAEAIRAADAVLFYVSKQSLASEHCNREINLALDQSKTIVPVFLENVRLTADLELGLNRIQAIDHGRSDYQGRILTALGVEHDYAVSPVGDRVPAAPAKPSIRRWGIVLVGVVVLVGLGIYLNEIAQQADFERQLRTELLPSVEAAIREDRYLEAAAVAEEIERLGGARELDALWDEITAPVTLNSVPSGAIVSIRPYHAEDVDLWESVGTTPVTDHRLPRGLFVWKLEKPGFRTAIRVASNPGFYSASRVRPTAGRRLLSSGWKTL